MTELQKIDLPPSALLERAITSGATVEVMERLMALQERWQANQAKAAFTSAMARLRLHLPVIVKNQTVDFTGNRGRTHYQYEDLHDVTEKLTPEMAKEGLSFRWRTQPGDPVTVTCIISHEAGYSEECALSAPRDESGNKNAIQALGSAITYLQRYTLKAALGVAAARDDDGQGGRSPSGQLIERPENSGNLGSPIRDLTKSPVETLVSKPVSQQTNPAMPEPLKATPKFRERMLEKLKTFDAAQVKEFAVSKGILPVSETLDQWPLTEVPTTGQAMDKLVDDIEGYLEEKAGLAPVSNPPAVVAPAPALAAEFSEWFWTQPVTLPPAGVKKDAYRKAGMKTIKDYYLEMKAGNEKSRTWLWGVVDNWDPGEWTNQEGQLMPPSKEDLDCRKALDAFRDHEKNKQKPIV